MFGLSLHEKAKRKIEEEFGYSPGGFQMPVLRALVLEAREIYPPPVSVEVPIEMAAMKFMLVQMDSLQGASPKARAFVDLHSQNALALAKKSKSVRIENVYEALNTIRETHGLEPFQGASSKTTAEAETDIRDTPWNPSKYSCYEDWFKDFKDECRRINPRMQPEGSETSILDWMSQDGLRRAFDDRIDPTLLAQDFMKDFDPDEFAQKMAREAKIDGKEAE